MLECLAEEIESGHWLQEDKKGRNWKTHDGRSQLPAGPALGFAGMSVEAAVSIGCCWNPKAPQAPRLQLSSECPSVMESTSAGKPRVFSPSDPVIPGEHGRGQEYPCDGNWKPSPVLLLTVKINFVHGCSFLTCVLLAVFTKYAQKYAAYSSQRAGFVINQILAWIPDLSFPSSITWEIYLGPLSPPPLL